MRYNVSVKPIDKPRNWVTTEKLRYKEWVVPAGFVTDGASIPIGLRWYFPHGGSRFPAAVVHDWGYRRQLITKDQADYAFYDIMVANGVGRFRAKAMYLSVKLFGHRTWKRRAKELQNEGTRGDDMR